MIDNKFEVINKGDMVVYRSPSTGATRPGIVLEASPAGSITIRWNDGSISVTAMASVVYDQSHNHFPA